MTKQQLRIVGRRAWIAISLAAFFFATHAIGAEPAPPNNLLAGVPWKFSADGGNTFTLDELTVAPGKTVQVAAAATVPIKDAAAIGGLWFTPDGSLVEPKATLNGVPIEGLLKGMRYRRFDIDPQQVLKGPELTLVLRGTVTNKTNAPLTVKLAPKLESAPPSQVDVQTGPAVGMIGPDFVTFTCRTNMPAVVTVAVTGVEPSVADPSKATSPRGFYHRLKVPVPTGEKKISYVLSCESGGQTKRLEPATINLPDFTNGKLRFVAAGDCRSHPERWALVAAAIEKAQPSLLVFNGDLVYDGRNDELWDSGFFTPASSLMKRVPFYPAPGNHEFEAPAYLKLFYTPADREENANWAQAVGPVLLIGVEGAQIWTEGSPNYKWLEGVLAASKEKFIFLANHYPAWSSGAHGKGNERPMLQMRNSIMPLLAKYHATALLAGHDHNYERNEPPAEIGVTSITTGGAGAPGRPKSAAAAAGNPYSKVFAAVLHYCLFEVDGDKCVMKVYDLDGKVIDEKTFAARKP